VPSAESAVTPIRDTSRPDVALANETFGRKALERWGNVVAQFSRIAFFQMQFVTTLKTVVPKRIGLKWFVLAVGLLGAGIGFVGMRLMRHAWPLNSNLSWCGRVPSDRFSLPQTGVIQDQETWDIVWDEWCGGQTKPVVDFRSEMIFFNKGYCSGNSMYIGGINKKELPFSTNLRGEVNIHLMTTLLSGPGFNCYLVKTKRFRVTSINGEPVTIIDLRSPRKDIEDNVIGV
jgi:hypothetical protein